MGESDEAHVANLREYGYNLGMAYQVLDDLLDYESNPEQLGKPTANDLSNGVLTLPAIMLMEAQPGSNAVLDLFESARAARANGHSGVDNDALAAAIESVRGSGFIEESRSVAQGFIDEARESLSGLPDKFSGFTLNPRLEKQGIFIYSNLHNLLYNLF